jgi:hypothetical protein
MISASEPQQSRAITHTETLLRPLGLLADAHQPVGSGRSMVGTVAPWRLDSRCWTRTASDISFCATTALSLSWINYRRCWIGLSGRFTGT